MDLYNGKPTGSIRVSLGYMTLKSDVDYFLQFIQENFIENDSILTVRLCLIFFILYEIKRTDVM